MKKVITILAIALAISTSYSQTVNDIPISEIDVEYIQIVGMERVLSNKITVSIDFGQENKLFSTKSMQIKDEDGKPVVFNSMIDSLNFLSNNGYEFVNAYVLTTNNQNVYHYVLRKKK